MALRSTPLSRSQADRRLMRMKRGSPDENPVRMQRRMRGFRQNGLVEVEVIIDGEGRVIGEAFILVDGSGAK
jgi:hypothetical protein